ncbi:class I SAM-dependent methyltransferase [Dehalogenimonas etheniformans]|uniref:Class I SAM-dependent methyltransferase n=1 Tax=Dehalogenimonas etheniformans TaxID=1536648 RepID=A0A2P5P6U4_9CHLR|nr:class I SAM-dependent methyltransferase [Dehalogenimonas etheniformans]PPD58010.1 class I SAM-dependent methyltransferase [Dehalogenimonas etheniformans]QNT75360.1 class I SAM-dependent methyltransferase [Dehalogenimonas etheniformans]
MTDSHFDTSKAARLDNPSRVAELRIPELLTEIGGVKVMTDCVDLGCGTGTFTLPMAEIVGRWGKVYAVDDSQEMLDILKSRKPPKNVMPVKADFTETGLVDGIAEFCLAAFILHETKQPEKLLAETYRLLKPGGRLLVMEWRAEFDSPGPSQKIRVTVEKMSALVLETGFRNFQSDNWSEKHYYGLGVKPLYETDKEPDPLVLGIVKTSGQLFLETGGGTSFPSTTRFY